MLTLQLLGAENGAQPLFWQILLNDHGCISSRWLWMALSQRGEEERVSWDREAKHHHAASVGAQRWQSKCKISTWCDSSWPWHKSLRWVTTQSGKLGSMPSKILKIQIFVNFAHPQSRQRVVVTKWSRGDEIHDVIKGIPAISPTTNSNFFLNHWKISSRVSNMEPISSGWMLSPSSLRSSPILESTSLSTCMSWSLKSECARSSLHTFVSKTSSQTTMLLVLVKI